MSEHPDLTPYATIRDVIYLVCRLRSVAVKFGDLALDRVGLSAVADRSIRELSMGQRRRAVMAAAWVGEPSVAIMDEPLEAMDRRIRQDILAWIDRLLANGAAVLIATHQIEPFVTKVSRVITVRNGMTLLVDPLPDEAARRVELLESLSADIGAPRFQAER